MLSLFFHTALPFKLAAPINSAAVDELLNNISFVNLLLLSISSLYFCLNSFILVIFSALGVKVGFISLPFKTKKPSFVHLARASNDLR
ncbi:hypothetical protein IKS57_02715 [bacterium]|nr:hypothetical protein [bacterium]